MRGKNNANVVEVSYIIFNTSYYKMTQHNYFVYIMTNKNNTVLYTGVCNDLSRRVWEHKNKYDPKSFTAKYNINKLVYFECFNDINLAISREKQIKSGSRDKKNSLIEKNNQEWKDLSEEF